MPVKDYRDPHLVGVRWIAIAGTRNSDRHISVIVQDASAGGAVNAVNVPPRAACGCGASRDAEPANSRWGNDRRVYSQLWQRDWF